MRSHFGRIAGGSVHNGEQEVVEARVQVFILEISGLNVLQRYRIPILYLIFQNRCPCIYLCVWAVLKMPCMSSTRRIQFGE